MTPLPNQDIHLDTANGTPIANEQAAQIQHPLAAQALVGKVTFPSQLRVQPHPRYNCHGLTFAARRAAVLNDADINTILADDGYRAIPVAEVLPGDIALYFSAKSGIDHSAVVVSKPFGPGGIPMVCSKWGVIGPEVIHLAADNSVEYDLTDIRYYRCDPE